MALAVVVALAAEAAAPGVGDKETRLGDTPAEERAFYINTLRPGILRVVIFIFNQLQFQGGKIKDNVE